MRHTLPAIFTSLTSACVIACLTFSVASAQEPTENWPPLDYYPDRIATVAELPPTTLLPEEVPPGASILLNPANPIDSAMAPAPAISAEVPNGLVWNPTVIPAWIVDPAWDGSVELGINATDGNAEAFSLRLGANVSRKTDLWDLKSNVIYAKSEANGLETQHNAIFNTGYERMFLGTAWSHFGKLSLEYDEFKAFDLRVAPNTGLGYMFLKTDATSFKGRFGAGFSYEINSPDNRVVPEAVFGADYAHQLSKRQKFTLTSDYFPEWTDFENYRLVTDMAWSVALDDASKLNLKLSVNDRYDSTPNGRKPNDIIYALLLIWTL